jgi:hypothetical protein
MAKGLFGLTDEGGVRRTFRVDGWAPIGLTTDV